MRYVPSVIQFRCFMKRLFLLGSRANCFEIPRRWLLAIVLGLVANGCQPTTQASPAQGPPALLCGGSSGRECQLTLFDVEPDDGPNPLIERLRSARTSIDFVPFMLDEPSILQALGAARERGVKVRVMLEPSPGERPGIAASAQRALQQAGIAVRPVNSSFALTHAKY